MEVESNEQAFCDLMGEMTQGMSSVRELVKSVIAKEANSPDLDFKDGISLLSLKQQMLLSYMQSLVLLNTHRVLGHTLDERSPPSLPFSSTERTARGAAAGDFVDSTVERRLVLEKIKVLEGRMRYQIDKLVRVADDTAAASENVMNDPLAFRPNPQNLVGGDDEDEDEEDERQAKDGIYRPPKLAPMPYTEPKKGKRERPLPVPIALTSLSHLDPSRPYIESVSGLGSAPSHQSARARDIQRMTEFEEENMTRLVMKKKDEKRRRKDEEDIALGGVGGISGKRRGGGLEDEFADVLRSVGRRSGPGGIGDGYEALRSKGRKEGALARSRTRGRDQIEGLEDEGPRQRKRTRFDKEAKASKRKISRGKK